MNLENLKNVDPANIDRSKLVQRSSVKIDSKATKQEKIASLFQQINPYCYLDGKTVVITRFKETEVSIDDCYFDYLGGL